MVEKCKKAIGKGNEYGALLTDLSKAFDCVAHNLVIADLFESQIPVTQEGLNCESVAYEVATTH